DIEMIFTPTETRDYQLIVTFTPSEITNAGDRPYTLLVERATFATENKSQAPFKVEEQILNLKEGKPYSIVVKSREFYPLLTLYDGEKFLAQAVFMGRDGNPAEKAKADLASFLTFVPARSGDYRLLVDAGSYGRLEKGAYTGGVSELKKEFSVADKLTK